MIDYFDSNWTAASGSVWGYGQLYTDIHGNLITSIYGNTSNNVVSNDFRVDVVECGYCHQHISITEKKLPERCPGCGARKFDLVRNR